MAIASDIVAKIEGANYTAITFVGGYLVKQDSSRILFPPGKIVQEKRIKGKVTFGKYEYADGSCLLFSIINGIKAVPVGG